MYITHLSLTNFRNYGRLELKLPQSVTLLHGANAQGKTNLLESIYYLATTRSPAADNDQQIINWDANQPDEPIVVTRLVAQIQTANNKKQIELRLIKEAKPTGMSFRREALIDRRKVRLMDLLGNLRVVLFVPQDMALINGSPSARRRYIDITLCQTDSVYCRTLSSYNKTLEQRNAALRRAAETGRGHDVVSILTDNLVELGSEIFKRRAQFIASLALEAQKIHYESLTGRHETIRLGYLPRLQYQGLARGDDRQVDPFIETADWLASETDVVNISQRFAETLKSVYDKDVASGVTSIGPHRDDWRFWVNGRSLASYGSRGQQRSAMLALKMAEIKRMRQETGEHPILLLDEVVAELDGQRRALLLDYVQNSTQAILTATDPTMFTNRFLQSSSTILVQNGRVTINQPSPENESNQPSSPASSE